MSPFACADTPLNEAAIPAAILHAATEANGQIVLVVGAGCSCMAPTNVPMANACSRDAYRRLVEDGVLQDGDCGNPDDLSELADTVFAKREHRQAELVQRLPLDRFKRARSNEGHMTAAALMRENVLSSILCLNYDLALEHALTEIGGLEVKSIAGPQDVGNVGAHNVVYIHRNVDEADFEKWIIRASALRGEWQEGWEALIAQVILTKPCIIFVGLGSPAGVLIETTRQIRQRVDQVAVFQIDAGDRADNRFFAALDLRPEAYIKRGWIEFMDELGRRVCTEQLHELKTACMTVITADALATDDVEELIAHLADLNIVELGKLRAEWLMDESPYTPRGDHVTRLVAPLLVAAETIRRKVNSDTLVIGDGLIEYKDNADAVVTSVMMVAAGTRSWAAIEPLLRNRRARIGRFAVEPALVVVSGATGPRLDALSPPPNIAFDEERPDNIIMAKPTPIMLDAHDINVTPNLLDAAI